jgi:hypothetical protein
MSDTNEKLPPCGLYRTTEKIGDIPANRLVYFHNHGNPGAGVYFPEKWVTNRAQFSPQGTVVPKDFDGKGLMALPAEGFYRVLAPFHCCEKKCREFQTDSFVQLGYNGEGKALMFVPELGTGMIDVPERGNFVDDAAFKNLAPLAVAERKQEAGTGGGNLSLPRGIIVH